MTNISLTDGISANCVIFKMLLLISIFFILGFYLMPIARSSTTIMKRCGEIGQPCLTPCMGLNQSEVSPLFITTEDIFLYNVLTPPLNTGPKLNASNVLSMKFQLIESKAFSKSTVKISPGVWFNSL